MAHIRQVEEDEASGLLERIYEAARGRAGSVANIIKIMSRDPRSTQGSMQFYVSLMKTENALSPARREMLATVVSNVNACYY
jgi:alkylhydroperoxidase family enzyme